MKIGWLSPEGKLHECKWYEHISMAYDLVDEYNIDKQKMYSRGIWNEMEMLLASGWIQIGKDGQRYSIFFPEDTSKETQERIMLKKLMVSDEQKIFLKHLYDDEPERFTKATLYWMRACGVDVG